MTRALIFDALPYLFLVLAVGLLAACDESEHKIRPSKVAPVKEIGYFRVMGTRTDLFYFDDGDFRCYLAQGMKESGIYCLRRKP